jgi:pimeloyl-ACP methyl ester carboxylesterase
MDTVVKLKDGRTLGYAEYGDLHGKPVFFFHGMPGSRFFHPPDEITRQLGVRLITLDRPGYGESTFQPGRRIPDWPGDVAQLADSLGLHKFAVAGHSGGGPYALACAHALPQRVTVAASLCGAGPVKAPHATSGMELQNKLGFLFGRVIPWPLWQLLIWITYRHKLAPAATALRRRSHRPPADEALMDLLEIRETCIVSEKEAFRPGLLGFAWDARLLTRPWGFLLEKINVPVLLWHGTEDNMTPLPMAEYVANRLPNCRATICEGEAHLLLFPHWKEILTQIMTE